jgi:hypothetical protein
METLRRVCSLTLASLLITLPTIPAQAAAYDGKPKLVVLIVIDQFREDYLATTSTRIPRPRRDMPRSAPGPTPMVTASTQTSGGT